VFILKGLKVVCFDTLLQVLILKTLTFEKNCADLTAKGRFRRVAFPVTKAKNASKDAGVTGVKHRFTQRL
jgi:hypothetical protein